MIHTILFDLDETLYPRGVGIMDQIRRLILDYVCARLGLPEPEADHLRREYLRDYGTTMRGLQINHAIDADDYLDYVHKIRLEHYIDANPALDAALTALPQHKVVFTNASREHAEAVLEVLGVARHFERIIDVRDMGFESKPQPAAYRRICRMLGRRPEECLLVEDNVRNLLPAKELGMITVLVGEDGIEAGDGVDYVISRVEEIDAVLAQIRN
ncbi:MAG: pyrimidine 5'-nucleotidase [Anaerolineae bacterium]|jgi:putative hydrolase of the HAD superfamily